jgi:ABC-type antimicrobial peptide transport system permease subunit
VLAESMAARRREIAIRTALGAQKRKLVRQMVVSPLIFVLAGEALGGGMIWAFGQLGSGLLYGVSARDPLLLGAVAVFLFAVSAGAALWPAWSAAGNDPASSLRAS